MTVLHSPPGCAALFPPTIIPSARVPWAGTLIRGRSPTGAARYMGSMDSRSRMLRSCRPSRRRPRTSRPSCWPSTSPEDSEGRDSHVRGSCRITASSQLTARKCRDQDGQARAWGQVKTAGTGRDRSGRRYRVASKPDRPRTARPTRPDGYAVRPGFPFTGALGPHMWAMWREPRRRPGD